MAEEEQLIASLNARIKEMEQHINKQRRDMGGSAFCLFVCLKY